MTAQLPERLPLDDVKILAVEQFGAGPWGTLQLAALGADVIKVEDDRVKGDTARYVPPYNQGEDSLFFETFNTGKRSISLDLKSEGGREVFHRLVEQVDVVFSNLRGDQPEKLGLRYADLAHVNPRIVCCSLTGYGQTGPLAAFGSYDFVIQGLAGWMSVTGEPGSPPTRAGLSLVDFSGGYVAAISILGGLWRARRDGVGCDCDLSLHETAASLLTYFGTWTASRGFEPERRANSAHATLVPFQNFETGDGWIVIACPKQELWARLCRAIGRDDLLEHPDYGTFGLRDRHRDALLDDLGQTFRARTTEEWIAILNPAGVPCGPVNDIPAALRDEQLLAREGIDSYEHETLGTVRMVRSPLRMSGPRRLPTPGPRRGEHTEQVLLESGFTPEEIDRLRAGGAFGEGGGATA